VAKRDVQQALAEFFTASAVHLSYLLPVTELRTSTHRAFDFPRTEFLLADATRKTGSE